MTQGGRMASQFTSLIPFKIQCLYWIINVICPPQVHTIPYENFIRKRKLKSKFVCTESGRSIYTKACSHLHPAWVTGYYPDGRIYHQCYTHINHSYFCAITDTPPGWPKQGPYLSNFLTPLDSACRKAEKQIFLRFWGSFLVFLGGFLWLLGVFLFFWRVSEFLWVFFIFLGDFSEIFWVL